MGTINTFPTAKKRAKIKLQSRERIKRPRLINIPAHLPTTDSIQRQITYGDYIAEKGFAPKEIIFNDFIMPYSSISTDAIRWTRTQLKQEGKISNPKRGVWKIQE